ncbi:MAG: CrcB family protein [Myxococcota bacterium]|nr:CrcB family protein [Myxococcales bacterium]
MAGSPSSASATLAMWLAIFAGGGLGACLRVAVALAVDARAAAVFPWGLFAVNTIGCFAIGVFATLADEHGWLGPTLRAFAVAGVLGGFTTFSSFGLDTLRLALDGRAALACANAVGSVAAAIAGVAAGVAIARSLG